LDLPYGKLFQLMIKDWRKQWEQGDFPFYFVQVGRRETCDGMVDTLRLPNTGMAIINDVSFVPHPPKKVEIGKRLALLALGQTYGRDIETSGPLYQSAIVEGKAIRVTFTHTRGGLTTKNVLKNSEEPCNLFTIAGENKSFVPADCVIEGDTVIVSSPKVTQPVAVRYGNGSSWLHGDAKRQIVILINKAGLWTHLQSSAVGRQRFPKRWMWQHGLFGNTSWQIMALLFRRSEPVIARIYHSHVDGDIRQRTGGADLRSVQSDRVGRGSCVRGIDMSYRLSIQ
jgi:hypothetical protein